MRINVTELTDVLSGNRGHIETVLTSLGYQYDELKFEHTKGIYRFRRLEGDNPTAISLWIDTLNFVCFTRATKGNIYTLVMHYENLSFPQTLEWIADKIGFHPASCDFMYIQKPFGGFYTDLLKEHVPSELDLPVFPEEKIRPHQCFVSKLWNDDGISYKTQETFGVGMDLAANAILVPERNTMGELIGIQARRNDRDCPHEKRWWAYLPCSRTQTLYGWSMNYRRIVEKGIVFLVESEKSVMKAYEMGIRNVLALCGCTISSSQLRLLRSLRLKAYILALDEGLGEAQMWQEAKKLLPLRAYYLYDREHHFLEKGSKDSPFDKDRETLLELVKYCRKEVK